MCSQHLKTHFHSCFRTKQYNSKSDWADFSKCSHHIIIIVFFCVFFYTYCVFFSQKTSTEPIKIQQVSLLIVLWYINTKLQEEMGVHWIKMYCEDNHPTGAFEIRLDPCSTLILGISGHRPGYFREASISSIMKVNWTQHCVFSYVLKEWTSWK